jgi:hypothetical protein
MYFNSVEPTCIITRYNMGWGMCRDTSTTPMHRGERGPELGTTIFRGDYRGAVGAMFFLLSPLCLI